MTLASGTRLGPYEILAPLGAGGMGEVYRARDSRLGRDLALKVLPEEFSADRERRQRFEQEARAASALNHPSVVHVYDVGASDSTIYIAMELIEGRTLRELLASGPLPARKLLDLAVQVADGLAPAHEAGIVHRDLKPENVMVTKDGHARILDFGLAKLVEPTEGDPAERSTTPQMTRAGIVLGTLGYMSPEQAAGRAVDFRSDQFSFGTIVYEMASGRRAFQRKTGPETLMAILNDQPEPLSALAPQLPAPLRWIVEERCLAKDPEDRYASTRDLLRELRGIREHISEAPALAGAALPRLRVTPLPAVLGVLAALGLGFLAGKSAGRGASPEPPRFQRLTFQRGKVLAARFAPDGQTIVYGARIGNRPREILSTRTDSPESRSLGLPPANLLSISSTAEMAISIGSRSSVGWEQVGTLARVSLAGGAPRDIMEEVEEADWAPDGRSLAIIRDAGGKRRLEFPVDKVLYETAGYISDARVSPKGDLVAFLDHPIRGDNAGSAAVVDLTGRKRTLSSPCGATDGLQWAPSGDEIWFDCARKGARKELWAVTLAGQERLLWRESGDIALEDISRDGRVLMSRVNATRETAGLAPGAAQEISLSWLDWSFPRDLSEDGSLLLIGEEGEGAGAAYAIYLRKTDGSPAVRLGEGTAQDLSPDGRWGLGSSGNLLLLLPIGAGRPMTLSLGAMTPQWAGWFPDGKRLLVAAYEPGRAVRLYVMELSGGSPRPISPEGITIDAANRDLISPDGKLVAARGPDLRIQLYPVEGGEVRSIPGSSAEEAMIRWTADGNGVYVHEISQLPAKVYVLDVRTGRRTPWKELAPADAAGVESIRPILIARDGKAYVYSYVRRLDDLYLVTGLK